MWSGLGLPRLQLKLLGFELGLVFGVRIRLSKTKSALRLESSVSVKAMVRS